MRSVTTVLANKSVLLPCSNGIAMWTGFRRITRIHKDHFDPNSGSFIHDLLLKLSEWPTVQTCTDFLTCFDTLTNIRKIFQNDQTHIAFHGIFNNGFADFVVDMFHMSSLSARSLSQCLFGTP